MNIEETIVLLKGMQNKKVDYAEMVCAPAFAYGYEYVYPEPEDYAIEEAIKALKEVQQYREIGTVEECRESKEKQIPKTPKFIHMTGEYNARFKCPVCEQSFIYDCTDTEPFFCKKCGQALRMEAEDD